MTETKNVQGPWYEETGPSYEDVINDLNTYTSKTVTNDEIRKKIIEEIVPNDSNFDFGSWRGYGTFLRSGFIDRIVKKWREIETKKPSCDN